MVEIRATDDFDAVRSLGVALGLDLGDRSSEEVIAAWAAFDDDALVGAIALVRNVESFVVNWMCVREEYRGRGLARSLLAALEADARRRGITTLWATARAPGFFIKQHFTVVPTGRAREALLADCQQCDQLGEGCYPEAVSKDLRSAGDDGHVQL